MIRRPPRSTLSSSSAASDVYKRQPPDNVMLSSAIPRCAPSNTLALFSLLLSPSSQPPRGSSPSSREDHGLIFIRPTPIRGRRVHGLERGIGTTPRPPQHALSRGLILGPCAGCSATAPVEVPVPLLTHLVGAAHASSTCCRH
eukprot:TRINITY_DN2691_c0_g4_i4.p1 TRINITY_DN2691_c0_g4~~TRINITY_DN2691_c0_g4_i4.p1  ORF type:complete len:143 (-),score=15.35 TRINITY_DN2691_c0_g4_i4:116-544(-)